MRINLFVADTKLKVIDDFCTSVKKNRSEVMVGCTLAYINKMGGEQCGFCSKPSIGKFKVSAYDWENGDTEKISNLCQNHYDIAKKQGEVTSV